MYSLTYLAISFGKVSTLNFLSSRNDSLARSSPRGTLGTLFFAHESDAGRVLQELPEDTVSLRGTLLLLGGYCSRVYSESHDGITRVERWEVLLGQFSYKVNAVHELTIPFDED